MTPAARTLVVPTVFYGGPGADSVPDVILTGQAAGDHFGQAISFAGDINDDGFDDVIVGAQQNAVGGTERRQGLRLLRRDHPGQYGPTSFSRARQQGTCSGARSPPPET